MLLGKKTYFIFDLLANKNTQLLLTTIINKKINKWHHVVDLFALALSFQVYNFIVLLVLSYGLSPTPTAWLRLF